MRRATPPAYAAGIALAQVAQRLGVSVQRVSQIAGGKHGTKDGAARPRPSLYLPGRTVMRSLSLTLEVRRMALVIVFPLIEAGLRHGTVETLADAQDAIAHLLTAVGAISDEE
jgi:transcriptional regulator with XRE-family HTH domain